MGGAVSSGQDNNELVDNLMLGNYIRSSSVERVFRAIDRADYMTPESRNQAYKDLAWRKGPLHLSSPCIYCEVLEGLEVKPGLSFLNIGSGVGYLSTMVGLLLGSGGISHGVEIHPKVVEYAIEKNNQFIENSSVIDDFDYCEPKYYLGNGLTLAPLQAPYDRVYCGAGCPEEYANYLKQLIRIGGILVMPLKDMLMQVKRLGETEWESRSLLNVTFAPLKVPFPDSPTELVKLEEQCPPRLQLLARGVIRRAIRQTTLRRHSDLHEPPSRPRPKQAHTQRQTARCPRRICIPIDERPAGNFNMLHDLDRENGANEMNALLSLVLSMGENRVAGALRFDAASDSSGDDDTPDDASGDAPGDARDPAIIRQDADHDGSQRRINVVFRSFLNERTDHAEDNDNLSARSLTLEFHDTDGNAPRGADGEGGALTPEQRPSASDVPVDVEVYLDSTRELPGTSRNEVEPEESKTSKREPGSDDDTESHCKGNDEKRQKLDSGFGENSPFSSSSPDKTEKSMESEINEDSHQSYSPAEEPELPVAAGSHRQKKRTRRLTPPSSTDEEGEPSREQQLRRRRKRRVLNRRIETRRTRLSLLVKQAVRDLPLPIALKKYINFGRRFQS